LRICEALAVHKEDFREEGRTLHLTGQASRDGLQKVALKQIAACHKRKPPYLHSTNTVTVSSSATEKVTVKQSPPFQARRYRQGRP
ncbi:MAG: hypothetical protein ACREKE_02070, partial [bacterium]